MAAPRFINELTAVTSLSSAAAVHILQGGVDLRTTPAAFITEAESFTQSGSGAIATTLQGYLRRKKIILGWIPTNLWAGIAAGTDTTDLSTYIANAATDCAGAAIYVPAGRYLANALALPSNSHFYGDGETSIFRPYDTSLKGVLGCESSSSSTYISGLTFRRLKFLGTAASESISQFAGLLALAGVKRCRVEDCFFEGSRGDGITFFGTKQDGSSERHNIDLVVKNCDFDGVNNENRNAISVIDCDGIVIDGCVFRNYTKSTMPGPIDFEPDIANNVIKNVRVTGCDFASTNSGTGGRITFTLGNVAVSSVNKIQIIGNTIQGGNGIVFSTATPGSLPTTSMNVVIAGNSFNGTQWPVSFGLGYMRGVVITSNTSLSTFSGGGYYKLGDTTSGASYRIKDLVFTDNIVTCNHDYALDIPDGVVNAVIANNIFDGMDTAGIRQGLSGGSTTGLSVTDNVFLGTFTYTIDQQATTKNGGTNVYRDNYAPAGAAHTLEAWGGDATGSSSFGPQVNTTAVGNVGTGEDNLITYALPANALSYTKRGVRITAWGTTANNSNTKEVKLYFGTVAIITTALTISQAGVWRITAEIFRTGLSAQDYSSQLVQGGATTLLDAEQGSLTQTETAAITIKCTGAVTDGGGGVNNDDIVQEGLMVEMLAP